MLRRISVENFYSIAERQTLDLTVGRKVDNPEVFGPSCDSHVNRAAVIFGNNASGKTNLLRAFSFLQFMTARSGRELKPDQLLPHASFQPSITETEAPSRIEVEFDFKNMPYRYQLSFNRQCIISESLHFAPLGQRYRRLFDRNQQIFRGSKDFLLSYRDNIFPRVGPNATFLSIASMFHHQPSIDLLGFPLNITTDVGKSGKVPLVGIPDMVEIASLCYANNKSCLDLITGLLVEADVVIKSINLEKVESKSPLNKYFNNKLNVDHIIPKFTHHNGAVMDFEDQSGGTQALFINFYSIFLALRGGGIAALDEIDSDIHPSNLMLLLNLFRSTKTNPKNAQLIMSAHSVSLLQELEKEEIFFVEKDKRGASQIYGLKDIQGVRRVDNFYAKYLTGAYGAIPHS